MKQFLLPLVLTFWAATLLAQVPQSFNYQAIARDKDGKSISAGDVTVTARILRNGTEVYSEQSDHTTTSTGLFTLRVGEGDPSDFQKIDWSLGGYTLQVSIKGAIEIQTPAVPIVSVPYALLADEVANERQQLVLNGNQLSITGTEGNTVTLAATGATYQAGTGIGIADNILTNTGDTDPTDDLTKTSAAGGDVSGTFSNLSVDRIKGQPVAGTAPQSGQVLKWDAAASTWKPDNDLNTVGSGNTATAAPILGDGSAGSPVRLAAGSANGQVLKWNGTAWVPAPDETGAGASNTYAAGTGISVTGSSPNFTIDNTGDINATDDLTTATNFGGDVSGVYNNLKINANAVGATELVNGAVTGAKIAQQNATDGQVLKWNAASGTWLPQNDIGGGMGDGWGSQTAVTGTALTGNGLPASPLNLAQQGASNGQVLKWNDTNNTWIPAQDLSASTLEDLLDVTTTGVTNGQVLQWNGSQWVPASSKTYSEGAGITIDAQNKIINTAPDVPLSLLGGGATTVTGTYPNLTVTTPAAATYTAGPGISVTGSSPNLTINNTGDTNAADDLTTATNFGGDVSGAYNNLQIGTDVIGSNEIANGSVGSAEIADGSIGAAKIADGSVNNSKIVDGTLTGSKIAQQGAANGQVLKWNGTTWAPQDDIAGGGQTTVSVTAPGLSITGNPATSYTLTNTGDTNAADDLTNATNFGGDVSGTYNNLQIGANAVGTNEIANGSISAEDLAAGLIPATLPPSGAAGGDLSGAYPNPTVAKIQGRTVATTAPTDGQVLRYSAANSRWEPAASSGWNLTGNSGTDPSTNFIGTKDAQPISFRVNDTLRMKLWGDGRLELFSKVSSNTFVGRGAGQSNTIGNFNTANGPFALAGNTTGYNNTASGYGALSGNTTGYHNTANGQIALFENTTGYNNTASGSQALASNKTGNSNVAIGRSSLFSNTTTSNLVAVGDSALYSNTGGKWNLAVGSKTLSLNTSGVANTAVGFESLRRNTTGDGNTAVGLEALAFNTTGADNTALGTNALGVSVDGNANTAVGLQALFSNTNGDYNTAIGASVLEKNITGYSNTGVGVNSMYNMISGIGNSGLGEGSLYSATGSYNSAIGFAAGPNSSTPNVSNTTALGYQVPITSSNSVRAGNPSVTSIGGQVGWTNVSDQRIKTAITANIPGLAFIQKLRPVSYRYDIRRQNALLGITDTAQWEGKYDIEKMTFSGFLAQEVEQAARSIGYNFSGVDAPKNDKSLYGLRYAEFTVPLVKAVQEQQALIEQQRGQLEQQGKLLSALQARLEVLEAAAAKGKKEDR